MVLQWPIMRVEVSMVMVWVWWGGWAWDWVRDVLWHWGGRRRGFSVGMFCWREAGHVGLGAAGLDLWGGIGVVDNRARKRARAWAPVRVGCGVLVVVLDVVLDVVLGTVIVFV